MPYSWFPFPRTRGENTLGSRATKRSWAHNGLVRHRRLGNELSAIALVDTCFTVGVDLTLVVVVDAGTCSHAFVVGVVCARESTVKLKLYGIILPFLYKIIQR